MLIVTTTGRLQVAELISEDSASWVLRLYGQQTQVTVRKNDPTTRAFAHMGDALRWAGSTDDIDIGGTIMEIRHQMTMLLEALGKGAITRDKLIEQSELIRAISKECQSTGLFQDMESKHTKFAQYLEADDKIDDLLLYAWNWSMQQIVNSGSQFLRDGVVILTMPLVARYLPEPTTPEIPEVIVINLEVEHVKATAGESSRVEFNHLVHLVDSWFADIDSPQLATDWTTAAVTARELDDEYQLDPEWVYSRSSS